MVNDFIFELGCEELPSGAVWPLASELADNLVAGLAKAQLSYGRVEHFATPRRLAVVIYTLQSAQKSQLISRKGPAAAAAFDIQGNPTQALLGFAKSCGVDVQQLTRMPTEKGEWMVYEHEQEGRLTKDLLPELIHHAIAKLTIAKPMRWGNGDEEFVRPVHWAVVLYGDEVINTKILGVTTGRESRGHRFHHPQAISIRAAKDYESQLKEAFVVANFSQRKMIIKEQITALAEQHQAKAVMPDELLDEVTSIVEWPEALLARFANEFLEVPPEALIASMQSHQKCFALRDKNGLLMPYFITIANIKSTNPQQVILGNEKVMRARLSDAAFFFNQDKKSPLSHAIEATKHIVFQAQLGSLHAKTQRIKHVMSYLSSALTLSQEQALRACELSKCDLLSGMVGEFPELQGLMGYYYALNDGEDLAVARALEEQYRPRIAADTLPASLLGKALSLADRLDTLVGIFAIGQKPSGVKDPFKLRRHALAVVRILISIPHPLSLSELIEQTVATYASTSLQNPAAIAELKPFILERLNSHYQSLSITSDLINAVRAKQDEWLFDFEQRLNALKTFITLPEASSLSASCKRVSNILNSVGTVSNRQVDEELLREQAEQELYQCINQIQNAATSLYQQGDYSSLLKKLAGLKIPVDAFFNEVMVMTDNEPLKYNRLALLTSLHELMQGVADISQLQS